MHRPQGSYPFDSKADSSSIYLDVAVELARFLTGKEYLHYGYWKDLETSVSNLRKAQEAYTQKVLDLVPPNKSILDIGGGAGDLAIELISLGHDVHIVVPSSHLAERCRAKIEHASQVHETKFENFDINRRFDICLFVESIQYIPLEDAIENAISHLQIDGTLVISDCFRTDGYYRDVDEYGWVGGGHSLSDFRDVLNCNKLTILQEHDITREVAPSVELEQEFYNLVGTVVQTIDNRFAERMPLRRRFGKFFIEKSLGSRRLTRLNRRLFGSFRNAEAFCRYNQYFMFVIGRQ